MVAVTEAQPSLRQTRTQAEGETTITPWEYPFRDSFLSYFSSTCESEQMLKRRTPNVKTKERTSMDKWQRRSPQTRSPQCGCSHGSADDFDTRRKKKNDRVQARGLCNFRSSIYNDNNIGFLKITDVNINYVTSVIIKPMLTSTR